MNAGDQVIVLRKQSSGDLLASVVGIGNEVEGLSPCPSHERVRQLVVERAPVAIGEDDPLMNGMRAAKGTANSRLPALASSETA